MSIRLIGDSLVLSIPWLWLLIGMAVYVVFKVLLRKL